MDLTESKVVVSIAVLCLFMLIGLFSLMFAHKFLPWGSKKLVQIWRRLGFDENVPWAQAPWPLSLPVSIWVLRILGAIFTIGAGVAAGYFRLIRKPNTENEDLKKLVE